MEINNVLAKKILTEAKGYLDVGFTHSLNPYSGCAFACRYCYVREMPIQRFKEVPWGEWLEIKTNAAENYRNEIMKLRKKNNPVNIFMSSATDPYQPIERKANITRGILEEMIENPPDFLQIQTRGPLITRDIDLLIILKEKSDVLVSMTIETDRDDIRRIFAPNAPGITLRLKALKELHDTGISTQASISPVLPFTPNFPKVLEGIVDHIWIDTLSIGEGRWVIVQRDWECLRYIRNINYRSGIVKIYMLRWKNILINIFRMEWYEFLNKKLSQNKKLDSTI